VTDGENAKFSLIYKDARNSFWTKKEQNRIGRKTKFAILAEIWTKSSHLIVEKCENVIKFDIFSARNIKFIHIHWTEANA